MTIYHITGYLDGGTVRIDTTDCGSYYIDDRIESNTKGFISHVYPEGILRYYLIDFQEELKEQILAAVYPPEYQDCYPNIARLLSMNKGYYNVEYGDIK